LQCVAYKLRISKPFKDLYCTLCYVQARIQFLRFGVKNTFQGGKISVLFVCLKQFFRGQQNFGERKKFVGALPPNAPSWLRAWLRISQLSPNQCNIAEDCIVNSLFSHLCFTT